MRLNYQTVADGYGRTGDVDNRQGAFVRDMATTEGSTILADYGECNCGLLRRALNSRLRLHGRRRGAAARIAPILHSGGCLPGPSTAAALSAARPVSSSESEGHSVLFGRHLRSS